MKVTYVLITIVVLIVISASLTLTLAVTNSGRVCGNGVCEIGESPIFCPDDCLSTCGNGICDLGEYANTCPGDCASPTVCGDGICEAEENMLSCPDDCTGEVPVLSTICTGEDLANYITQNEGTSSNILSELHSYCFDNRPYDLDGCPMSQEKSTFGCWDSTCIADCLSACTTTSGHVLFSAIWLDTDPIMVMGKPDVGVFTVENGCSNGLLSTIFGLPKVQFR